ncbi:MAG: iron-sulfur cluster insertion protein ErpA [Dongiaceae bacterium]
MAETLTETTERAVRMTDRAAERVASLIQLEGRDALMLRLSVSGGGCSGFQYGFTLDDAVTDDDIVFPKGNVKLVVDTVSLDLLAGAEVDFIEDLVGSYFRVNNPNASSSCGCGTSFSI